MTRAAAKTGSGPTVMVAVEQNFSEDQRIITDELAYAIQPFGTKVFLWLMRPSRARDWIIRLTEKTAPGLWGGMVCRKRYIDEKLLDSIQDIGAVVNLGAGSDTRLYRLQALAHLPAWEIDQQENINAKRTRIVKTFGAVPDHVTLVAIDFDHENLGAVLVAHGFSVAVPTFFIWEAVTQYLTESAVKVTFDFFAKATKGSRLAFTYVRKDFLEGRVLFDQENLYKRYVAKKVWLSGMDPEGVPALLATYGWRLVEDLDYETLAECYVKPTGRKLSSLPVERVAYAEKL